MSELLAVSFDMAASPEIRFEQASSDASAASGWGLAWYPPGELTAVALRDPSSSESAGPAAMVHDVDRFRTTLAVAHLRGASARATHRDTQPFVRSWGGRSWAIAHAGALGPDLASALPLPDGPQFVPGGPTDTDHLLSWLLAEASSVQAASLAELGYDVVGRLLAEANLLGTMNVILADGEDLVVRRDANGHGSLWWSLRTPPHRHDRFGSADITLGLGNGPDAHCSAIVVASVPLSEEGWIELQPGEQLVARRGRLWPESHPSGPPPEDPFVAAAGADQPGAASPAPAPMRSPDRPRRRLLEIDHTTRYRYDTPVERSSHWFRLAPVADAFQQVAEHHLEVNAGGTRFQFEDVFGNTVVGFEIDAPFDDLMVSARSVVEVLEPIDRPELLPERHTLPLVWMPWQHQMMTPYLLPAELPENELRELAEFAMSFAERNHGDLLSTLDDITTSIYRDFAYTPGFTTLETTPYEVFRARAGVCQDFANLMITICRLLAVPARYRVGYIHTGADYANTIQSEASHAWVEVYLPYLGWRGYDPTNGARAGSDHVRVATGRNYRDATPTAGVLRRGGAGEQLTIDVKVRDISGT